MREKIYVLSAGEKWKVKCEHCTQQWYATDTQAQAITIARVHVSELQASTLSQILVQGDGGKFRTEWTYGKDPFPPRG